MKSILLLVLPCTLFSCNQHSHTVGEPSYKPLRIKNSSKYYYTINNETETKLEVSDKKIDNTNQSQIGLIYKITKDSSEGYAVSITFDSLHIITKNNDNETEMDASNATNSFNPVEKMLGSIKGSTIYLTLSKTGKIISRTGYTELLNKIISGISFSNDEERKEAQSQIDGYIDEGLLKNNIGEDISLFPDSSIYVGDSWIKKDTQTSIIPMYLKTTYTLTNMTDSIAEISSESSISNNQSSINLMGYTTIADFSGDGEGEIAIDIRTGMLQHQSSDVSVKGTLTILNQEVPIIIKIKKEISVIKLE